jgi:hypothetical protein
MAPTMLMAPTERNTEFAAVVEELAQGRSNRELARLTGISATYIGDMKWGDVPSYQIVRQYADTMGATRQQRARLFRSAQYLDQQSMEELNGGESNADRFLRGLRQLAQEFHKDSIPVSFSGGLADLEELTPQDVDDILRSIREQLQEDAEAERQSES